MIMRSRMEELAIRAARNEQYLRLQKSMPSRFKMKWTTLLTNEMLSVSIDTARNYVEGLPQGDLPNKRKLKKQLLERVRGQMDQPRYSSAFWSFLLWWLIPMFVEWFIKRWLDDLKTQGVAV